MTSPTTRVLTRADIDRLVLSSELGARCTAAVPLAGGSYAAVWRVTLSDGRDVVVKVAPAAGVPVLRYEAGLVTAEADYFARVRRDAPDVPVPDVLFVGDADGVEWLVMTFLAGSPLTAADGTDTEGVRRELGGAVARLHRMTAPRFGYSGLRPHGATWPAAFGAMTDSLLADAADWGVDLGDHRRAIPLLVAREAPVLAGVERAAVLHFDLWDGNVLADAAGRLTGLVDGERWLGGDPLVDFVSPALFRRIEDEPRHPFVRGYTAAGGGSLLEDPTAARRLGLYRLFLSLLMLVEQPSRGRSDDADWCDFLRAQLDADVAALTALPPWEAPRP